MEMNWRIGVVGNIVQEHLGEDGRVLYGTKEFVGGTKVYIDGKNWSNYPRTKIEVIGLGRFHKYEIVSVNPELIENVRFQLIRKKNVLDILDSIAIMDGWEWWGRTADDKREAKQFVENWNKVVTESKVNKE